MFIPGGWWYAVLNLGDTISIKENFCNIGNFDRVWYNMRKCQKTQAYKWLLCLEKENNDLYQRALTMNRRDLFEMWKPTKNPEEEQKTTIHDDEMTYEDISIDHNTDSKMFEKNDDPFLKQVLLSKDRTLDDKIKFMNFVNCNIKKS